MDGDKFHQHNAFRAPGAPSLEELTSAQSKVEYLKQLYSKMHRGIFSHDEFVGIQNLDLLNDLDFAFLCLDAGDSKGLIIQRLEERQTPFIDVGMGLYLTDGALGGILRITTSTPTQREHVRMKNRISMQPAGENNEYNRNIQIADLNALNAALAVVRWKKLFGFYHDFEHEHFTTYTIDGNILINEDRK
jgi:hypothetical protein